jgi:hypothetical protein
VKRLAVPDSETRPARRWRSTGGSRGREVQQVADDIGSAGASTLKKCVTEAVNDYLAPTLNEVRRAMNSHY